MADYIYCVHCGAQMGYGEASPFDVCSTACAMESDAKNEGDWSWRPEDELGDDADVEYWLEELRPYVGAAQ
jgi:hypothetical protein